MTIELNNNIYTDGGNDTETTPVVLVHGFPVDHRMWDECAAALRDQAVKQGVKPFAIWAPDMPGAGEGPIPSDEDSGGKDATARSHTDWTAWRTRTWTCCTPPATAKPSGWACRWAAT